MSSEEGPHVDPVDLIEYARGGLSRPVGRRVRDHCMGCAECGDQLAAILLLRERANVRPAIPRWRPAAAAAVVALIGLGWLALGGLPASVSPAADVADAGSASEAPRPATTSALEIPWSPRHETVFPVAVRAFAGDAAAAAPAATGVVGAADDAVRRALAAARYSRAADLASDPAADPRLAGVALYLDGRIQQAHRRLQPVVSPPSEGFLEAPALDRFATIALAASLAELNDKVGLRALLADWPPGERTDQLEKGLDQLAAFAGR